MGSFHSPMACRRPSGTVRLAALVLAVFTLALLGCGDDSGSPEPESGAPEPTQSLDAALGELNRVIKEQDCGGFVALTYSALRTNAAGDAPAEAGEAVRPEECEENGAGPLLRDLEGTRFTDSENYVSAAVAEGPAGEPVEGYDTWTVILLGDRDGKWRHLAFIAADPQFEEDLPNGADPVAVAEQLVRMVKNEDCSSASDVFGAGLRFGDTPREACETLGDGTIFAPAVRRAGEVTVEELGTTRDYSIVGIDTGRTYFAVYLGTPPIAPDRPPQDEIRVREIVPMTDFQIVRPSGRDQGTGDRDRS